MLKIITVPNKILTTPSKPVKKVDKKIKKLARQITNFLKKGDKGQPLGVGLSACQVGKSPRLCIVYDKKNDKYLTLINPKITWRSKQKTTRVPDSKNPYEGCLSIPGVYGKVKRSKKIKVSYQNLKGTLITKKFSGFTATVIQHECDHLNGILFVQRVLEQGNKLYKIEKDEEGKEHLIEISL